MPPSCTPDTAQAGSSSRQAGAASAARTIDELLFLPGTLRALDAGNQLVPRVRPATLGRALDLIGRGRVATIFGQLRGGVVAVDVDMADGRPAVAELIAWCTQAGLWHVVRSSGRPGHAHVLIVAGQQQDALELLCGQLRTTFGVSRTCIDVRDQLRPLSAPHRSGTTPPLPSGLPRAARALPAALRALDTGPPNVPTARVTQLRAKALPRTIRPRPLPPDWADYLATGIEPAQVAGWKDASRSAVESTATWQMVAAGWTDEQAWLAIQQGHPTAFTKARTRGRRWWTACTWNKAVDALQATPPAPPRRPTPVRSELDKRIGAHRAAFTTVWTRYPDRRRHSLRRVLDVLLDRMSRTADERVPCPQRDLVADTGLSRPTIAGALQELHQHGWIVLERTFTPASTDPAGLSHHARLPQRPPASGPPGEALSGSLPPSSFTPQPLRGGTALRLACLLGPRLWHLYLALHASTTPTSLATAAHTAGWTEATQLSGPAGQLTARTTRTVLGGLSTLASLGLADTDEHGQWTVVDVEQASDAARAAAADADARRREQIEAERAAYAQVRAGRGRWHQQRAQALQRGAVARQLGAHTWWASLTEAERVRRRSHCADLYRCLSPTEQLAFKTRRAEQRQQAGGLTEDQLHLAWTATLTEHEHAARSAERARWYRTLPIADQRALCTGWQAHRDRWHIQRRGPTTSTGHTAGDQSAALSPDLLTLLEHALGALTLIGAAPTNAGKEIA